MARPWVAALVRGAATVLMAAGVGLFLIGLLGAVMVYREAVTGLVGEGSRLGLETPEEVRRRLTVLAGLVAAVVVGWLVARVGDAYRGDEFSARLGARRLAAEVLLLVGAVGVVAGMLAWAGPRASAYETPAEYSRVGHWGIVVGPVLLALGVWAVLTTRESGAGQ